MAAVDVTRTLASFAAGLRYKDLPREVVESAKTSILNIVAAALGGSQLRLGGVHARIAATLGGNAREATLIGTNLRTSAPAAAYANGSLAFALDYEDVCQYVIHPGPIVVPAVLAVGEAECASGRALLTAVVAGYEVGTRIGWAMQPTPERGSKVWGQQYTPFASCAAVGNLLRLDAATLDSAFGIAGTYAPVPSAYKYFGIVAETRPMREAKLGWGWMSMAGTMGALSARAGLGGGHGILDGPEGFWIMAGSDRCDFPKMLEGLGTRWLIETTDFKLHPSIAWNHPPYVALQRLIAAHAPAPRDIAKVRVWNVGVARIDDRAPAGPVDAQFSLPYTVATALLRLPLTPELYSDRTRRSRAVRALLERIECMADESMDRDWFMGNRMRTRVEITLNDGRVLTEAVAFPADKPAYGRSEVIGKLHALGDGCLPAARLDELVARVEKLERMGDVGELTAMLRTSGTARAVGKRKPTAPVGGRRAAKARPTPARRR